MSGTKCKLCGLTRPADIAAANALMPEYIGFVFAPKSRRCLLPAQTADLKRRLTPGITAVGVFVNEAPETVADLLSRGVIDAAQLHGREGEDYIKHLRTLTNKTIVQAFKVATPQDVARAEQSTADCILLDSGAGSGTTFDWALLRPIRRPYFLAGGLDAQNVADAIRALHPYAVDVSSGIEENGRKDAEKMAAFVAAVRKEATP